MHWMVFYELSQLMQLCSTTRDAQIFWKSRSLLEIPGTQRL